MALDEQDRGVSTSVVRAFELLDRVAGAGRDGITLAQLSAGTPKARSTTHRYVTTLLALGAIRRDEAGRLRLGLKLLELATGLLEGDNLRTVAEPVLRELGERTGETVHLGVPSDGHVVYIAKVESPQSVRLVSRIGVRVPLHCTAMGKAIMSQLSPSELSAALELPREIRTVHTITARDVLLAELDRVRHDGVAIDNEENEIGVRCMAAVIVGSRTAPVAAISVSGPAARMNPDRCAELAPFVAAAAQEIGRSLGYPVPAAQPI
jgi:IclR family acetate operon transcriptional repressor